MFITDAAKREPLCVDMATIAGTVTLADGTVHVLTLDPAPAEERPAGEAGNRCSHYVGKAVFMAKDAAAMTVHLGVDVGGARAEFTWADFVPLKFAHHQD